MYALLTIVCLFVIIVAEDNLVKIRKGREKMRFIKKRCLKNKEFLVWGAILVAFLFGIFLTFRGARSEEVMRSLLLSVGTGLCTSSVVSFLFYIVQKIQTKFRARDIRKTYISLLRYIEYLLVFYPACISRRRKTFGFKGTLIQFLEQESKAIAEEKFDDQEELLEIIRYVVDKKDVTRWIGEVGIRKEFLFQIGAITVEEYEQLDSLVENVFYIKSGLEEENIDKTISCYSDLLKCLQQLISITSEIDVLGKLLVNGTRLEMPEDKKSIDEQQTWLKFFLR